MDFTSLGLVEMTRKRTRESLEHVLCDECPVCEGRGTVKTIETVCFEIMREIVRVNRAYDAANLSFTLRQQLQMRINGRRVMPNVGRSCQSAR